MLKATSYGDNKYTNCILNVKVKDANHEWHSVKACRRGLWERENAGTSGGRCLVEAASYALQASKDKLADPRLFSAALSGLECVDDLVGCAGEGTKAVLIKSHSCPASFW